MCARSPAQSHVLLVDLSSTPVRTKQCCCVVRCYGKTVEKLQYFFCLLEKVYYISNIFYVLKIDYNLYNTEKQIVGAFTERMSVPFKVIYKMRYHVTAGGILIFSSNIALLDDSTTSVKNKYPFSSTQPSGRKQCRQTTQSTRFSWSKKNIGGNKNILLAAL